MGEFVFNILVAAAELERATIKQRIQAGVDHAKAHGTKSGKAIGRPKRNIDFNKVLEAYQLGHGNYSAAARFLTEKTGQKVAPGYVWNIIQHRAQELGVEVQELVSISQEISTERRS